MGACGAELHAAILARFFKSVPRAGHTVRLMNDTYGKVNLDEVEDMNARYGMQDVGEARYLREDVGAEAIGATLYRMRPGKRTGFGHRHTQVEELYFVLSGAGRIKIDDDIVEVRPLDAIWVAPQAVRELEAGPDGLELLATGGHAADDGEMMQNWWPHQPEADAGG
jgi:mannose-6-phosphate isomerase-like protein (cupin superfamily)